CKIKRNFIPIQSTYFIFNLIIQIFRGIIK
ncbi:MAG: hypothetical protein ACJAX4_004103, partial [Clostridium sp.]